MSYVSDGEILPNAGFIHPAADKVESLINAANSIMIR